MRSYTYLYIILLGLIFFFSFAPLQAGLCKRISFKFQDWMAQVRSNPIEFSSKERQEMENWLKKTTLSQSHKPVILEDHTLLQIRHLNPTLIEKIFHYPHGRAVPWRDIDTRMKENKFKVVDNPTFDFLVNRIYSRLYDRYEGSEFQPQYDPVTLLILQIKEATKWSKERVQKVKEDLAQRILESEGLSNLNGEANPAYEIKVINSGNSIRTPDGQTLKILQKLEGGTLVIEMPFEGVMQTQSYLNLQIVSKYLGEFKKPQDRPVGFEGEVTADGRFFILDGHHRTKAYGMVNQMKIPALLKPHQNGRYYAKSHLSILRFYAVWDNIPVSDRNHVYRESKEGRGYQAIYPLYYKYVESGLEQGW